MENIGKILQKRPELAGLGKKPIKKGGVNSAFNNAVGHVVEFMAEKDRFAYWCGRLRRVPTQEIWAMLSKAKEGKKPRALFNWLLKEYRKTHKSYPHPKPTTRLTPKLKAPIVSTLFG